MPSRLNTRERNDFASHDGSEDDHSAKLKRTEGQVRGIEGMIDARTYRIDFLP